MRYSDNIFDKDKIYKKVINANSNDSKEKIFKALIPIIGISILGITTILLIKRKNGVKNV